MNGGTDDREFEWALQHNRAVGEESRHSPWPEILAEFGTVEKWHEHCRKKRQEDTERPMVRVLLRLMTDSPNRPRGTLWAHERERLLEDRRLAAYWSSVARCGDEGWREERARIARRAQSLRQPDDAARRQTGIDAYAARTLMPTWRAWGQVLLDAGLDEDLECVFVPPGEKRV